MSEMKQTTYTADIDALNEIHMAVLFLIDSSVSTHGKPNEEINDGLKAFLQQTSMDELAMKRVDFAIMTFGDKVELKQDFIPISKAVGMTLPHIPADGKQTRMGEAIEKGIDLVRARCATYHDVGVSCHIPWIFLLTDGEPTDSIDHARELIRQREDLGRLKFFSVSVNGANMEVLKSLSPRTIMATQKDNFKGIFNWVSDSCVLISRSRANEDPVKEILPEGFVDARKVPQSW